MQSLLADLAFPSGSMVKNLSATQETQKTRVRPLGQEDPLEEEMATHCSTLAWRIPWAEKPGGPLSRGWQRGKTGLNEQARTG